MSSKLQVNCANCVAESNQTIATTNGKFQIVLKAKDGDKIGQIGVNIKSCSKLGRQIRSNTWTIEEPNSEANWPNAAARDEWTEDKGFMLGLNIAGIEYLRENEMPAMELQLIEVGRDDDADSVQDNSRQLRELERATLSEELTANSGSLSPFILFTRQKSKSLKSAADSKFNFERLNATKGNPPMAELNDQSTKSKLPFGSKWKYAAARIGHPNAQNYHKRRSGSAAVSDNDGIRLGNRRSINAEIETLGTNAQPNAFCNETESRTPSFTKNIRTNTNLDDKEDENALRKRILNRMCCLMLPKLRKHKKRSGESNNSTAANSAEDITRAGGISPPNQELNAGESWHTDDIGIGTGTSNAHSPNEGNIYGIIDNKNNYNNNYDAGGDFGVQYQRQTMHGDWHGAAGASPIQSDGTEQNAPIQNPCALEKSVNEHHYSISRSSSSTKAELLLLSVLIKMPVFNRRETEEQDNFIYTFKLPPPNEIPAEEVNRQQLKVEPRPMPTARTTSRNNSGKAMSAATTGMTSNSSTYRNVGLDTKLDNSYEEQFQRTLTYKMLRLTQLKLKKRTTINKTVIMGGKKEKVPEEVVGKGKKIVEEVKKEGNTKKPKSTKKVGETSNAQKESPKKENHQNLEILKPTFTINVDGAESPKKDKRFDDSPDHWTEQSSNSKDSIQILESEQEVQNSYDAYDLNNDQNYEETDQSVASSELIEKDKESLHQNWDRIKPDRITKNSCQDSGKLPESTFLESEKLSEIEKKWMKTPPNEGKDGIIVAEHAEVVGGDFVDVQQQQLDKNFDPKEGQTIENAVQNEEELSQREDDQNNLKKVDGIRSHEQSLSSTPTKCGTWNGIN
uniref:Uncharacterized protein n=1 Tax=Globodera rostochiensis TaxID=31243 RepID=A0A914H1W8_GLORO